MAKASGVMVMLGESSSIMVIGADLHVQTWHGA